MDSAVTWSTTTHVLVAIGIGVAIGWLFGAIAYIAASRGRGR